MHCDEAIWVNDIANRCRAFYDRKRAERKGHTQAVVAFLARRRVNVVWAMLRDGTEFEERSAA